MISIISVAVKAILVTLCAFAAASALRRGRASTRHAIFASMFVAVLALPLISLLPLQDRVTVPLLSIETPVERDARVDPVSLARTDGADPGVSQALFPPEATDPIDFSSLGMTAYQMVALFLLMRLAAGVLRLSVWGHRGQLWLHGSKVAADIAHENGIRRAVVVMTSADTHVPMTYGFRKQTVLMPVAAEGWDEGAVRRAIRHELEHVRRDDWVILLLARVACSVYWPLPMVWAALRRLGLEAERACDDSVITSADAPAYADQLVTLARITSARQSVPALAMASPSRLSERVHAILDPRQPRGPLGRAAFLVVMGASAALLLTAGSVSLVAATDQIGSSHESATDVSKETDAIRDGVEGGIAEGVRGGVDGAFEDIEVFRESIVKAAETGNIRALSLFFEDRRIDINTAFIGDGTAVLISSRAGRLEAVEWLLDRGADPNVPSPGDGNALIAAAGEGETGIMELLLARGARIEDVVEGDENALITASAAGRAGAVRLLIDRGADVNARVWADDREWRTPLSMARRGRHQDIERMLLRAGARE